MKPAVARNILRNGIATRWDSERVRVGAGEALPSLGTTATMDSNSSKGCFFRRTKKIGEKSMIRSKLNLENAHRIFFKQ